MDWQEWDWEMVVGEETDADKIHTVETVTSSTNLTPMVQGSSSSRSGARSDSGVNQLPGVQHLERERVEDE